jgi:small subunit ribosomal protein S16
MAVVIRLSRHGRRNQPIYRVVVADKDYPRDGRFLEVLGTFNPQAADNRATLKAERLQHWISQGAVPSDTVARLIKRSGIAANA